ncbi:hypothetical protein HYH03_003785 [Edaphochlamys debaryana]|uniref:Uncharacterized protein n=1 Tax=Edaphochlamys debaryana TaxID=47281 RepID=A0A836C392_9CHLO|nr:hypothetical protein HYH03_003785 [Edaphochlamys debaryana]|eukprot:KAG2498535.1 hypothetical protein HYH03_003785 [Edaphochlamys debaryana]
MPASRPPPPTSPPPPAAFRALIEHASGGGSGDGRPSGGGGDGAVGPSSAARRPWRGHPGLKPAAAAADAPPPGDAEPGQACLRTKVAMVRGCVELILWLQFDGEELGQDDITAAVAGAEAELARLAAEDERPHPGGGEALQGAAAEEKNGVQVAPAVLSLPAVTSRLEMGASPLVASGGGRSSQGSSSRGLPAACTPSGSAEPAGVLAGVAALGIDAQRDPIRAAPLLLALDPPLITAGTGGGGAFGTLNVSLCLDEGETNDPVEVRLVLQQRGAVVAEVAMRRRRDAGTERRCTRFRSRRARSFDAAAAAVNALLVLATLAAAAAWRSGAAVLGAAGPLPPIWAVVQLGLCVCALVLPAVLIRADKRLAEPGTREPFIWACHAVSMLLFCWHHMPSWGPGALGAPQLAAAPLAGPSSRALAALCTALQPASYSLHVKLRGPLFALDAALLTILFAAADGGTWCSGLPMAAAVVAASLAACALVDLLWRLRFLTEVSREVAAAALPGNVTR